MRRINSNKEQEEEDLKGAALKVSDERRLLWNLFTPHNLPGRKRLCSPSPPIIPQIVRLSRPNHHRFLLWIKEERVEWFHSSILSLSFPCFYLFFSAGGWFIAPLFLSVLHFPSPFSLSRREGDGVREKKRWDLLQGDELDPETR